MDVSIERDTLGGFERWDFRAFPAEDGTPDHLRLIGYERTDDDGGSQARWDLYDDNRTSMAIDDVPFPIDLVDEARAKMLDQARLAIRAYVSPVYFTR